MRGLLPSGQFDISRRNLPHWQLGGSTYFITYRCVADFCLCNTSRNLVLDNWRYWDNRRYLLHTAVVMPDHVHVLITPMQMKSVGWFTLETILHTNKSYSAHEIDRRLNRSGAVWQDERYDRIVRNDKEFWEKWQYIAENALRCGLTDQPIDYPWLYQNPAAFFKSAAQIAGM